MKRIAFTALLCCLVAAACHSHDDATTADAGPPLSPWTVRADVFVSGHDVTNVDCRSGICRHNENVDMINYGGAAYMVHRTAYSQTLGPNSSLWIYKSTDDGATFPKIATLPAPEDRDLRDPAFFTVNGELFMKALARLPIASSRDSNVDTESLIAHSPDGVNWTPFQIVAPRGWSFWRVKEHAGIYYSAAYADGDTQVALFSSPDGLTWTQGASIYGVAADTPLETELTFFPSGKMLALVRMDGADAELFGDQGRLRTKVCWASPPYVVFDCHQELSPYRLDGPVSFFWNDRLFVIARKHLTSGMRKRTALFEVTSGNGGAIDDGSDIGIKEWGELPSAGDTSYAGIVAVDDHRFVTAWYSGDLDLDEAWILAMFNLTDIWKATLDFSKLK